MFSRFGLRFRMAASYVAVSAVAVLIVEAVLLTTLIPQLRSARNSAQTAQQQATRAEAGQAQTKAQVVALGIASSVGSSASAIATSRPGLSDGRLLAEAVKQSNKSTTGAVSTTGGRSDDTLDRTEPRLRPSDHGAGHSRRSDHLAGGDEHANPPGGGALRRGADPG